MHKQESKSVLIESLTDGHTITAACKRAGVSRMFYDRHYKTDTDFRKQVDAAKEEGRKTNEDLILTMHMKKIRDGHWQALQYALKKKDAADAKADNNQPTLGIGDIRFIIDQLPEGSREIHYMHLRELLDDTAEFKRTGKIRVRGNEPGDDL